MHFLLFADSGAHQKQLNAFANLMQQGKSNADAFQEAFGSVDKYQADYTRYVSRAIYQYAKLKTDVSVDRQTMPLRRLSASEAHALRAAFHTAMGRPTDARAAVDEARRADPNQAAADLAQGLILERDGKSEEARAAFAAAVEHGSDNAYAYYRLALLSWGRNPDRETLTRIEKYLTDAVRLNDRYAAAYALLAETRGALVDDLGVAIELIRRAVKLERAEAGHHLAAARVFWRYRQFDAARKEARVAGELAANDYQRSEVERTLSALDEAEAAAKRLR